MTVFTASNGVVIRAHPDSMNVGGDWLTTDQAQAVHEFLAGDAAANLSQPWKMAKPGEVWLLAQRRGGKASPWTKQANGEWAQIDEVGRHCVLTNDHFSAGNALWSA